MKNSLFLTIITVCLIFSREGYGNNIQVSNVAVTDATPGSYALISFNLSWENSWRTSSAPNNWDAAWLFVKYRVAGGEWRHAWLNDSGHITGTGTGAVIEAGLVDNNLPFDGSQNPGMGALVYRSSVGTGTFSATGMKLRWNYNANGIFNTTSVEVKVFAIEMVYVAGGGYYLGDGASVNSFEGVSTATPYYMSVDGAPLKVRTANSNDDAQLEGSGIWIDGDDGVSKSSTSDMITNFNYPTGYRGFYCMKGEITQGQYRDFLNALPRTQQNLRTASNLSGTNVTNRFVMSNTVSVANRNGLRCDATLPANGPVTIYCDLDGDGTGNEPNDGQWLACNYLSWADGIAYLDWSGLRPMTELEYEKAARGSNRPVAGEYAWGTTGITGAAYSLSGAGTVSEGISAGYSTSVGNAAYISTDGNSDGPLRVGIFAANASNSGRVSSGGGYYGVMELSGNLWERAVTMGNINGRAFSGLNGNGQLDVNGDADVFFWPGKNANGGGLRGGSWYDGATALRVSDRTEAAATFDSRDATAGFRGCRGINYFFLDINSAVLTGILTDGKSASGVSISVPYTNGDGGSYSAQTITSTGVTGLTATLPAGNLASGSGNLVYNITGTPSGSGSANFALNIGGHTNTLPAVVYPVGSVSSLGSATITGTLFPGQAASGVSASVPYTGGNGGAYDAQTISSTGITGLAATLAAGDFNTGSGSLSLDITGTPSGAGTASFALNIGGQTGNIIATVSTVGVVTSLLVGSATVTGTLTAGQPASGVIASVPYSGGNGGAHTGQTVSSTGITGLTATLSPGSFASGSGSLSYEISGTASGSGTASFTLDIGGQTAALNATVSPVGSGTITSLNLGSATVTGTLRSGQAASGVSASVPYTGGNGGTHNGQTVTSTGVTGLTAQLSPGNFASGSGSLSYNISGTPSGAGIAAFPLGIGGQTGILSATVTSAGTITSLNIGAATLSGVLASGQVASGVSANIPYTGGSGGTHSGQSVSSTGVTGLTATLTAGNFSVGSGSLTYDITGTPSGAGTAGFAINIGGQTGTLNATVLSVGSVTSLNLGGATVSGVLTSGQPASGVTAAVPYSGGNGGAYSSQFVSSTGVTGLTATLSAGNFASGSGSLALVISGTPSGSGTANFTLSIGGQSGTLSATVLPIGTVTTLNFSAAVLTGTLTEGNAASGVSAGIPYTGGNGGFYSSQSVASSGVTGLTANLPSGVFNSGSGTITYSISGIPSFTGTASFALDIGGQTGVLNATVSPAGIVTSLNIGGATISGILIDGQTASGVSASIPYTGGNGGSFPGESVVSTGVTGLTASLSPGNFSSGSGNIVYNISGIPSSSGTASFTLNIGGQTGTVTAVVSPTGTGTIVGLNLGSATISGILTDGQAASGVSASVPYTGGNGGTHGGQTVTSTGVTGLTVVLSSGNFATGSGNLLYNISGTPVGSGTASFSLNIGGQTGILTVAVSSSAAGVISSLVTGSAVITGSLTNGVAASGVSASIPYTGGNGGAHGGQTVTSTGITGLTATLSAGVFASGSGTLTYQIIGTPSGAGSASFALSIGGQSAALSVTVLPVGAGTIAVLDIGNATVTGTLVTGQSATGVSASVPYTGGDGGAHNGQTVTSTGITGLTANLAAGNFNSGSGILAYTITGVPAGAGTASFALNIGGKTGTLNAVVSSAGSITSLVIGGATLIGTLTSGQSASGVSALVPYDGGNGGTHSGQNVVSTGVTGLTANLGAGMFASGSGNLTYTITGTPAGSGTASFALNIGGVAGVLNATVTDVGSISSLKLGCASLNGNLTAGQAASGVSAVVPYGSGNGGMHNGQTVSSTGVTGLTATLTAGNFASGSGNLTYNISGTPSGAGTASFALNIGGQTGTLAAPVIVQGTISSLTIGSATVSGTMTAGQAVSGVSASVPYTGGNGGSHNGQTVVSTGVTGLTAMLSSGTFASGSGNLVYTITGSPSASGTAAFALNIGGQTGTLNATVLPAGAITSLNVGTAIITGTLSSGFPASGVSANIPYTGGNGGSYGGQSVLSTGVTGLTATLVSGTFANGSGSITYNITGTPSSSGTASFSLSIGGRSGTLNATVLSSGTITALNVGSATITGSLVAGQAASGVSANVPYTGGNGGGYSGQSVPSDGVSGLTATLAAGTFANGSGNLTFNITGTPSGTGTASFEIYVGGRSGIVVATVSSSGSVSSLNIGSATLSGQLSAGQPAIGVSAIVPYTGGNGGAHTGQTVTSTGITGLTAVLAAGSFASGSGNLQYIISGTPSGAGTASFALNIGGQTGTLNASVTAAGSLAALNIGSATLNGLLIAGQSASGTSITVPYTGGNGGSYNGQSVSSTGITGLTASLVTGSFASGSGNLTYNITGIPSASGTASFALNIGGQTGTLTAPVLAAGAGTITALGIGNATIAGTLSDGVAASGVTATVPYTGGNGGTHTGQTVASTGVTGLTATLSSGSFANGSGNLTYNISGTPSGSGTAGFALNIGGRTGTLNATVLPQGAVGAINCSGAVASGSLEAFKSTTGFSVRVPYTGGNGGSHTGQTVTSTGVTGLTATLTAGSFASGAGTLTYSVTGTPSGTGVAAFALSIGGKTCTLNLAVGQPLCRAKISSSNSKIFMCHNLAVANTNANPFTPGWEIIGGYWQWGRKGPDPANWLNTNTTNFAYGPTGSASGQTNEASVTGWGSAAIAPAGSWDDAAKTASDPCPTGYRVPTNGQWDGVIANNTRTTTGTWTAGTTNYSTGASYGTELFLPAAGYRQNTNGTLVSRGNNGGYWSSTEASNLLSTSNFLNITPTNQTTTTDGRRFGHSIRCIVDDAAVPGGSITNLDCAGVVQTGSLRVYTQASGVSFSVPYTGGNGGIHNGQTVASTGITGLTATLAPGIFASGSGLSGLTYTVTGTPAGDNSGTASFDLNIGGKTCTVNLPVQGPGTITSLDCSSHTKTGTIPGPIVVTVPYTGGDGGAHNGQTVASTGVTGMSAKLLPGTFNNGSGTLTYTVTGGPSANGNASFALNIGGKTCTLTIPVTKYCGAKDNSGQYREWMCYNLGSANTNADPYTPGWEINGGYWRWGRKQPHNTGPSGPSGPQVNDMQSPVTALQCNANDSWSQTIKTANDPCPTGYRVPARTDITYLLNSNTKTFVGTWNAGNGNYTSGLKMGDYLFFPSAGWFNDGSNQSSTNLVGRGASGRYWTANAEDAPLQEYCYESIAYYMIFYSNSATLGSGSIKNDALSVRCIKE